MKQPKKVAIAQPKVVYDPNFREWVEVKPGEDPNSVLAKPKEDNETNFTQKRVSR